MVGQFFCSREGLDPWKHGCSCNSGGAESDAAEDSNLAFHVVQEKMRQGWRGNAHIPAYTRLCFLLFRKEKRQKGAGVSRFYTSRTSKYVCV